MIEEFIKWWAAQLFDLVPARFRSGQIGDALVVELDPTGGMRLWSRRNRRETALGRFGLDAAALRAAPAAPVVLRVPGNMLLEQPVILPLAAEREIGSVLRFEMDRLTPFRADDVFWTSRIEQRDPARAKATWRLSVVPKAGLAPAFAMLREAGRAAAAIEAPGPAGEIRLISVADADPGASWRGNTIRAAGIACAVLALIAIFLPFALQSRRAALLDHKIAELRPPVARAEALRRRISAGGAGIAIIADERGQVGDPLAVLAAVTNALPDSTFLTEMTLNRRRLDLAGQSAAAAALLSALSANPLLRDAAFSAPVTRDSTDHQDLFVIAARVAAAANPQ